MGMKFHKIYVAILIPLGILLIAIAAVLMLFVALNVSFVADNAALPYLSNLEAGAVLWTLFGLTVAMFLLLLMTEFLLVARKRTGILLLSLSLMLGVATNVFSLMRYGTQTPWYSIVLSVLLSTLILTYYWRRYSVFE
ncbi:MAG TPA: hypothetical protein P5559_06730 [Candidatus Limiplasma sp.]|nr:hypothetical protein [Candidatus Limiplasma sp.]